MMERLTIALPKGALFTPAVHLFEKVGLAPETLQRESRKLMVENPEKSIHFMILRASDVPTYVEYGAADLGVVGKDMLLEQEKDLYEPLDLKFGRCALVVAAPVDAYRIEEQAKWTRLRVATKYPRITEKYFTGKGVHAEIIKLYGSIELAPQAGLSEIIVDLAATGKTLKENNLEILATIVESTARLIVNRASLKLKFRRIQEMIRILNEAG
jgi:ATP phosphoribosyltransferase